MNQNDPKIYSQRADVSLVLLEYAELGLSVSRNPSFDDEMSAIN
jgi:hypothetical protein